MWRDVVGSAALQPAQNWDVLKYVWPRACRSSVREGDRRGLAMWKPEENTMMSKNTSTRCRRTANLNVAMIDVATL
jgi:hypothetical protein